MEKPIELSLIDVVIVSWIIFLIFFLFTSYILYVNDKHFYKCDLGKNETLGDQIIINDSFHYFGASRDCAVRDCLAFNEYQKQIGGQSRCVV